MTRIEFVMSPKTDVETVSMLDERYMPVEQFLAQVVRNGVIFENKFFLPHRIKEAIIEEIK